METTEINLKKEKSDNPTDGYCITIKNHKKAASHLAAASQYHLSAARYFEEGNFQNAAQCAFAAHSEVTLSNKVQKMDLALNG